MEQLERTTAFCDVLRSEGFFPTIDDDGDVRFKYEGRTYYLLGDASDDSYFRLFHVIWTIDAEDETQCRTLANDLTRDLKVVKVYLNENLVMASVEAFYSPLTAFQPVLMRLIGVCQLAGSRFRDAMNSA